MFRVIFQKINVNFFLISLHTAESHHSIDEMANLPKSVSQAILNDENDDASDNNDNDNDDDDDDDKQTKEDKSPGGGVGSRRVSFQLDKEQKLPRQDSSSSGCRRSVIK